MSNSLSDRYRAFSNEDISELLLGLARCPGQSTMAQSLLREASARLSVPLRISAGVPLLTAEQLDALHTPLAAPASASEASDCAAMCPEGNDCAECGPFFRANFAPASEGARHAVPAERVAT
jgi:hypothetical protein